jgi:hypothetical protein
VISIFIIVFRKSEIKCKIIYLCETVIHENDKSKSNLRWMEKIMGERENEALCEKFLTAEKHEFMKCDAENE